VLKTGIPWEELPREMGCGCGMACWRRLAKWEALGVWKKLHELLLAMLEGVGEIDWSRAVVDSASIRARGGGGKTGPNPTDRRKLGSKHHVITDAEGTPLAAILTSANTNDVTQLLPLVEAIPQVRGKRGHPKHKPDRVQGDRGDVSREKCQALKESA
jgi:transposase